MKWCDIHYLTINLKKTQEMVLDPQPVGHQTPVSIHDEKINQVSSYRYLGFNLDNLFSWQSHVDYLCLHFHQRLYFLLRLRVFGVNQ